MGLRKIAPGTILFSWTGPPKPAVPKRLRQGRLLARISRHRGYHGADASDPDFQFLADQGFITISRGPIQRQRRTVAAITEAGWVALWTEDLGAAKPVPKSQRVEKYARHV